MHTILGAGGSIARELTRVLLAHQQTVRLVSRNPVPLPGTTVLAADLTHAGEVAAAVQGASIVYLCAGLPYNSTTWQRSWPIIMQNTIDACKQHQSKLIFFDNVYALGRVDGPMKEDTPFNPCSKKGQIRADIATRLLDEMKADNITALIARSADFYGPGCKTSGFNLLVTDKLAKGKKPQYLVNADTRHSLTYTPDCGQALWLLSQSSDAFNQVWHLPTAHPALTGRELIKLAAVEFGVSPGLSVLGKGFIRFGGIFNRMINELYEMLYQNEYDYIFDSSKFENAFGMAPTTYKEGIKETVRFYKQG